MTQEEVNALAKKAGMEWYEIGSDLKDFAELVALREREVVANWIMDKGFATGHGDAIVDLLDQLEWQIAEKEREACAKVCEYYVGTFNAHRIGECADAIRARGQA